jgi:RND family efflux transporter MFP subunit
MKYFKPFSLITISLFIISACTHKDETVSEIPKGDKPIPVKVMDLRKADISAPVSVSGQFTTDDETILSFKTGGIISSVLVREGDYVKKGQLLATLDLTEIKAQVEQAGLAYQKAQRDHQRAVKLYADSVVTLEQMENSKTGLDISEQQLKAARFNLQNSEVRAVKEGYVLRKFVNSGQIVGAGTPVFQTNGAGNAQWILRVAVSDKDWGRINVNDGAKINIDALNNSTFDAYVSHKMEGADPYTGSFVIELKIKGKAPEGLAAGLYGKATIFPKKSTTSWAIPYESLMDGEGNNGYVFVTSDNKTARKIPVTIASIGKDFVHINSGLEQETQLIITGSAYLKDGSTIEVKP